MINFKEVFKNIKIRYNAAIKEDLIKKVYNSHKLFHKPLIEYGDERPTCPFCGHPLVQEGQERLESLCEHVGNPNGIPSYKNVGVCKNEKCKFGKFQIWDWDSGEQYSSDFYSEYFFKRNSDNTFEFDETKNDEWLEIQKYIPAAGNSISLKIGINSYKYGQLKNIYFSPFFGLLIYQPYIEMYYEADKLGNILKKSWKLGWLKFNGATYSYVLVSWFRMLRFSLGQKQRTFKNLSKNLPLNYNKFNDIFDEKCIKNKFTNKKEQTYKYWSSVAMIINHPITYFNYKTKK